MSILYKHLLDFPVDHMLNLLMGELQRYRITIAGMQETKWFGSDVWPAARGWVAISMHSDVPLVIPSSDESAWCGEGVGILLSPCGVEA